MKQRQRARSIKRRLPGGMPWPAGGRMWLVPVDMATLLRGPSVTSGPDVLELRAGIIGRVDCGFMIVSPSPACAQPPTSPPAARSGQ